MLVSYRSDRAAAAPVSLKPSVSFASDSGGVPIHPVSFASEGGVAIHRLKFHSTSSRSTTSSVSES